MNKIAKFEKVSFEQFKKDFLYTFRRGNEVSEEFTSEILKIYNNIKLPERATKCSAGYDFFTPVSYHLTPGESVLIPTGIKCNINFGWVLQIYPRSGHGFKYGVH
ncbi:MAG: deoxyuridine 5'-triphosphate nucleotidohydrolase, partial [bacterium]|nr:deoxyuridine 5'-triphosphate nucleotidohydrolase [bacterium]